MEIPVGAWTIRSWRTGDEEALSQYLGNPNVSRNLVARHPHPYKIEHARAWIHLAAMEAEPVNFAIANNEKAIGGVGLTLQRGARRQTAEIGYWLGEPFWGQGIATETVRAFTDFAFSRFDLRRLQAYVFDWNAASIRVLEKANYAYEGRLGKSAVKDGLVIDELLYAQVR
jgi:ribosomal-protein-alanine N-acetyltransferase